MLQILNKHIWLLISLKCGFIIYEMGLLYNRQVESQIKFVNIAQNVEMNLSKIAKAINEILTMKETV